ncbi:YggS family pyridoxal phosphate-dependent enzyme [Acidimicrobiia bacterium EGI L10123]|uniref:YggS family pyridoxal phosphate-dependent enzyme n=1 Tax=Salinilacustrithrix flava TaxID=2957203 RepID=UPI003D7C324E|nr:YggS family pyridoxal phosphate-dependent enzyme [Acidimicrobiia bacterium EGI L10123]
MTIDAADVTAALERVLGQVSDAGGDPDRITVVAVTKGFGPEAPIAALRAGLVELGENYAQELQDKAESVAATADLPAPSWHFIGRLQSNKVRLVADRVACWQSLDRASVVDEVAKRAPGARALIQVNAAAEDGKGGASLAEAPDLVARARDGGLDVVGLMAVGVAGDAAATESAFAATASLADDLGLPERSMGMSGDLAEAVRSGTTMIRVGTALFGPRPTRDGSRPTRPTVRD